LRALAIRSINDINLSEFEQHLKPKYAKTYIPIIMSYVRRFKHLVSNNSDLRELDNLNNPIKSNAIHGLIIFSKYLGLHEEFKNRLKNYGIKPHGQNAYDSFIRILGSNSNSKSDVLKWYNETLPYFRDNEKLFLKYCLFSGLRRGEVILSFNKVIELSSKGLLSEYYDKNLSCLLHFKYREFIRGSKNCLITFVKESFINEIANSKPISDRGLHNRMFRQNIKCRVKELRRYYATFMLQHGILEGEVNLLQGRINSILFKHYFTPKLSELRDRIFKASTELEQSI
jgi:intergrase/recombinase